MGLTYQQLNRDKDGAARNGESVKMATPDDTPCKMASRQKWTSQMNPCSPINNCKVIAQVIEKLYGMNRITAASYVSACASSMGS